MLPAPVSPVQYNLGIFKARVNRYLLGAMAGEVVRSAWLTPVLMVYYLCCWPGSSDSDTNSDKSVGRRGVSRHDSGSHRRASELFSRRAGSSAVSLHLPTTSGGCKEPLSSHRSHEEIRSRRPASPPSGRHHSAPSVIEEVLHRRDWERSTRELYIPLRPEEILSASGPEPPHAEPESSSIEDRRDDESVGYGFDERSAEDRTRYERIVVAKVCKKHHTNIKSSKSKAEKEGRSTDDDRDSDATEVQNFYIGDNDRSGTAISNSPKREDVTHQTKSIYKPKEAKQSFNESIRSKERPKQTLMPLEENRPHVLGFRLDDVIDQLETLDRSGATHHTIESRISLTKPPIPPPSVETVGWEGGACYLPGVSCVTSRAPGVSCVTSRAPGVSCVTSRAPGRHASDGDILAPAPACRPESGAFSESDLDLDVDGTEELPPPYSELYVTHDVTHDRKETAI